MTRLRGNDLFSLGLVVPVSACSRGLRRCAGVTLVVVPFVFGLLLAATVGCAQTPAPATSAAHATPGEWKALIGDSYDGQVDGDYHCATARAAVEHLPHDRIRCTLCMELQAYERRIC